VRVFPAPLFVFVCRALPLVWSPPPVHFNIPRYILGSVHSSTFHSINLFWGTLQGTASTTPPINIWYNAKGVVSVDIKTVSEDILPDSLPPHISAPRWENVFQCTVCFFQTQKHVFFGVFGPASVFFRGGRFFFRGGRFINIYI